MTVLATTWGGVPYGVHLHGLRQILIDQHLYPLPTLTEQQWWWAASEPNLKCDCNLKFCPVCIRKHRYRQKSALLNRLGPSGSRCPYQALTVALPAIPPKNTTLLRSTVRSLSGAVRALLRDELVKSRGSFVSIEVKISSERIHAHAHAMVDCDDLPSGAIEYLLERHLPSATSHEMSRASDSKDWARYCCKSGFDAVADEFKYPDLFLKVADAIRGLRRFDSFGSLLCTGRHRSLGAGRNTRIRTS
jgi:hypothetical protein